MTVILWVHIAAGLLAILSGAVAAAVRKGGPLHARAGTIFIASMLALGASASILEPFRQPEPGSPLVGIFVCYFVLTSWMTARRRDGTTGRFEAFAGAAALSFAGLTLWGGLSGSSSTPVGQGPVFVFAGLFLLAGLLDISAFLRTKLTPAQRLSRHLWRMCFAFFIATGSFFLGQQGVMPETVQGSPILLVLGLAPLALMLFWLVRVRSAIWLRNAFAWLSAAPARQAS